MTIFENRYPVNYLMLFLLSGDGVSEEKGWSVVTTPGYRFKPTDEELIVYYLSKKISYDSPSLGFIQDIDAPHFFSDHPREIVAKQRCDLKNDEVYFFIHYDKNSRRRAVKEQEVGNGIGFWRSAGKEEPIRDEDDNIFATKIHSTFFLAKPKIRKTEWNMEEFRLKKADVGKNAYDDQELGREEWVVAKIRRGRPYDYQL